MNQQDYYPHTHNYPQVAYENLPMSKPADYSDLEAIRHHRSVNTPGQVVNEKEDERRICGFRVATFWLSLALILVLVFAAIGGGIGGGFASADAGGASHTTTVTVAASTTKPPTATSSTPSYGIARNYCRNQTTYTTPTGWKFLEYCGVDWGQGSPGVDGGEIYDIAVKRKGSYQACMDECAVYNDQNPKGQQCKAIAFDADLTVAVGGKGGNCWLKNEAGVATTLFDYVDPELYSTAELLSRGS